MKDKRGFQVILILVVLLLAGAPAAAGECAPVGDVILADGEGLWFVQGDEPRAHLRSLPWLDSELELAAVPSESGRSVVWVEARSSDFEETGLHIGSSSNGHPGSISLYVDSKARVIVNEQGLKLHESAILFSDGDHYLARCGDDLCWHGPGGVVNLTAAGSMD